MKYNIEDFGYESKLCDCIVDIDWLRRCTRKCGQSCLGSHWQASCEKNWETKNKTNVGGRKLEILVRTGKISIGTHLAREMGGRASWETREYIVTIERTYFPVHCEYDLSYKRYLKKHNIQND